MPAVSKKQRRFMGAELGRTRAGKKTVTGMTRKQLKDFTGTKEKGLPLRKSNPGPLQRAAQRSGIGIGGAPRRGRPKTDAQRRLSHGPGKLPSRGAGLKKQGTVYDHINLM